jgi:hypothetical protein
MYPQAQSAEGVMSLVGPAIYLKVLLLQGFSVIPAFLL